ncbi:unnamed protein product [Ectocarpus sp. 6 AP-2014]
MDTHTSTNVHAEFRGQAALYSRDVRHNVHKRRYYSCKIFSFFVFKIRDVPRFQKKNICVCAWARGAHVPSFEGWLHRTAERRSAMSIACIPRLAPHTRAQWARCRFK